MKDLNWPRIRRLANRILHGPTREIRSLATQITELAPAEKIRIPEAIHSPDSLSRIRGLSPWRSWIQEQELVRGGVVEVPPCMAYGLRNAEIVEAHVYAGSLSSHIGSGPETLLTSTSRRSHIDRANLVTTIGGSHYFGAKMLDDFAFELNDPDPENNARIVGRRFAHEDRYRELMEIDRSKEYRRAHVEHLTLYDEPNSSSTFRARRYRELRSRLRRNSPPLGFGSSRIYLKRGASGTPRILVNEAIVEAFLHGAGFDIVEPSTLDVDEIVRRTSGARIVVSVEGSHMSHTQFTMHDQAAFIVIQPPDRFSTIYKQFTDCMDMSFGFVVGRPDENGFTCDLRELGEVLDRVENRLGRLVEC